jgi:hypothetical protein
MGKVARSLPGKALIGSGRYGECQRQSSRDRTHPGPPDDAYGQTVNEIRESIVDFQPVSAPRSRREPLRGLDAHGTDDHVTVGPPPAITIG